MAISTATAVVGGAILENLTNLYTSAKQMRFQERMSSTSYQRGMEDMKKAGLNPILAYQRGGASTPSGSAQRATNIAAGLPAARLAKAQVKTLDSQAALNNSAASLNEQQLLLTGARTNTEQINYQIFKKVLENTGTTGKILRANLTVAEAQATAAIIRKGVDETGVGKVVRELERLGVPNAASIVAAIMGGYWYATSRTPTTAKIKPVTPAGKARMRGGGGGGNPLWRAFGKSGIPRIFN